MSEPWDWELTKTADRQFGDLDGYAQDRISSKLDEIVTDQWREPMEYLEPPNTAREFCRLPRAGIAP